MEDKAANTVETSDAAPRARLVVVNSGYLAGHKMKCRLGDGPEFAAFSSFVGRASPQLRQVVSERAEAEALLRRYHRIMWAGYGVGGISGALMGAYVVGRFLILLLLPEAWKAFAETVLAILWPAALLVAGCGFYMDYSSYRCFLRMVEAYNAPAQAEPTKQES